MSDDSFIREVDEELRQERLKAVWSRFGNYFIGAAVLVVLATAALRGWDYYQSTQAASSGDIYLDAVEQADNGNTDAAIASLQRLAEEGYGQYPALARFRIASELADRGESAAALAEFDRIAGDSSFNEAFRSVAQLRAGLLAVDVENYEQVKARLEPLAGAGDDYRDLAREALGLAAMKAGANEEAVNWFQQVANDAGASNSVKNRVSILLDLLAGRGVTGTG